MSGERQAVDRASGRTPGESLRLSVVIPAYNEEKLIAGTLAAVRESLAGAGLARDAYEIVVCDNASADATAALAADGGAHVVFEPERQIARARNTGAAAARAPWLLFLDADSRPHAALMRLLLAALDDPRLVAGGCTMRMQGVPAGIAIGLWLWNATSRLCRWASGAFVFCRADAFRAVGGFGLDFYVAEEIDFSRRIKRWGASRGLGFRILRGERLLTSGRKARLYSQREIWGLLARMLRNPRRFFRDRSLLYLWYDGRR
ncbi:MAG: glycosyltransferase [Gammaproteobacteria bacterium]|nr:glycosyltransferase [Gammaproteobacteria bacterium]